MFLARAGVSSLVIDKSTFPRDKICGDALSGKVVEVLDDLDPTIIPRLMLESQLGSHGVTFVAPNLKALRVPFRSAAEGHKSNGNGTTPPGFLCRRIIFDDFLVRQMAQYEQIQFLQGIEAHDFKRKDGRWIVSDRQGDVICSARLLLVADGAQSRFSRHVAGLKLLPRHYTAAIRGYYQGVQGLDEENFVEMHFLKEFIPGYFWIFPLPNGWANVGAGMRSDTVGRKRVNLRQRMLDIMESSPQLRDRFAGATLVGSMGGMGLPMGSLKRKLSGDGYMLLGDAAWLIDPFTGEGIGNAVASGRMAAACAVKTLKNGSTSGVALRPYDQAIYDLYWSELMLSRRLQSLLHYPWLFNTIVNKAVRNPQIRDSISLMYENVDLRKKLKRPGFYLKLLFS
jgi:geranylgeranyl reductase family protein